MSSTLISNPILTGFHPDPSICRAGDEFFIATSTFEWWPAVRIHRSHDLVNWRHAAYAVTRTSQLDLRGTPDSGGVWAPCLSYQDGLFWLVYSNVRSLLGAYKDVHNYIVTAPSIEGPWSERSYVNSSGFDPSLFHDADGRSWFLNQQWTHVPGKHPFNGILIQEYDRKARALVGEIHNIFRGTPLGITEAPHLYRREGWYYLMTAEGGTSFEHAVTIARSKSILGPYEVMSGNPLLTAIGSNRSMLQRTGHASLVETQTGDWYMAYLCGRPNEWENVSDNDTTKPDYADAHCILGRETGLAKIEWDSDGWPRLPGDARHAAWTVETTQLINSLPTNPEQTDHFNRPVLGADWNSLRNPVQDLWCSLSARPGHVRLIGRESFQSTFDQSLIARRQQHLHCSAETSIEFSPINFQQMAGLATYYNTRSHAYLHVTAHEETCERVLRVLVSRDGAVSYAGSASLAANVTQLELGVDIDATQMQFRYRLDGEKWQTIGDPIETYFLSDEFACRFEGDVVRSFGFTGNFLALACQDLSGARIAADFDYFRYVARS
jgi:xylan 1,4-beta-xylosidase